MSLYEVLLLHNVFCFEFFKILKVNEANTLVYLFLFGTSIHLSTYNYNGSDHTPPTYMNAAQSIRHKKLSHVIIK